MNDKKKPIILGIDPGSRQIGVSVFRGEKLIFYAVKSIKRKTRKDAVVTLRCVLDQLIAEYGIGVVAIEQPVFVQQRRSFVKTVYDEMLKFFRKRKISIFEYTPKHIKVSVCGVWKPTKKNAALILTQRYPELARYFDLPQLWQRRYYAQLFDAIAAGFVCARELKKTASLCGKSQARFG